MKIDVISDLHVDRYLDRFTIKQYVRLITPYEPSDVLIIAGDLSDYRDSAEMVLLELSKYYKKILVVFGNHDLYPDSSEEYKIAEKLNQPLYSWQKLSENLKGNNKIILLDGDVVEIGGFKFGGTGGWYDLSYGIDNFSMTKKEVEELYQNNAPDSARIPGMKHFNWDFFLSEFEKIKEVSKISDIIITHISPSQRFIAPSYKNNPFSNYICFSGDEIIKKTNAKVWVFGHTHFHFDEVIHNTRLINNAVGYQHENIFPSKAKSVELK